MFQIEISIDRVTDYSSYPGWVECSFYDVYNNKHTFIEKIPAITSLDITPESSFLQKDFIRCKLMKKKKDSAGRKIFTVSTKKPDGIETADGLTEFDLWENQVSKWEKPKPYWER